MSALSQFSRPDYLGAWNRLGLEVRVHLGKKFNGYAPVIERCESLRPNAAACNATILVYALTFLKQAGSCVHLPYSAVSLDHWYIYRVNYRSYTGRDETLF